MRSIFFFLETFCSVFFLSRSGLHCTACQYVCTVCACVFTVRIQRHKLILEAIVFALLHVLSVFLIHFTSSHLLAE